MIGKVDNGPPRVRIETPSYSGLAAISERDGVTTLSFVPTGGQVIDGQPVAIEGRDEKYQIAGAVGYGRYANAVRTITIQETPK